MKIVVVFGSHRKNGQTMKACQLFESELKKIADVEFDYEIIKGADLKMCGGCAQCFSRGEQVCPYKDDRDKILEKMDQADGIIFASSNYALNIPNIMKNFFDRTAFVFHRPRFFHKVFTGIVTQGVYGGNKILKYFGSTASLWGGIFVKGINLTIPSGAYNPDTPWTKSEREQVENKVKKLARRYAKALNGNRSPKPFWFNFMVFRSARTFHKYAGNNDKDYKYYQEKGWLESDYYYPVTIGFIKKLAGFFVDAFQKRLTMKMKNNEK